MAFGLGEQPTCWMESLLLRLSSTNLIAKSIVASSSESRSPQRTLLPAALVSFSLLAITEIAGTQGPEGHVRFDSQWGSRHSWSNPLSADSPPGVATHLRVPVFDGASGLGYRMPNFDTTNHGNFLMVFREWLPAHVLSVAFTWLAVALCWSAFDLVGRSWNGRNSLVIRLWFTAFIAVTVFSFLLHNNWSIALSGMMGVISSSVSLFHRDMFRKEPGDVASRAQSAALIIASFALLAGSHPRYALTLVPVAAWRFSAVKKVAQQARANPVLAITAIFGLVYVAVVLILELRSLGIPASEIPKPRQNNFDFLIQGREFGDWRQFLRSFVLNSALPLFLLTNWLGLTNQFSIQYEFVNFGVLFWLTTAFFARRRAKSQVHEQKLALRSCSAAIMTILLWMTLTTESTSFPTLIQLPFKADAYDLHFPTAALVIVIVMISSRDLSLDVLSHDRSIQLGQLAGSLGVAVCLLYPVIALVTAPTLNGEQSWGDLSAGIMDDVQLDALPPGRLAAVMLEGRCGYEVFRYRAVAGVGHAIALARMGIATVEGSPRYRALKGGISREGCYSLQLTRHKCESLGLDFLSVGMVLEHYPGMNCPWLTSVRTLGEYVAATSPYRDGDLPKRYGNFYLSEDEIRQRHEVGCVILIDCLDEASRTIASQSRPPWQLCEEGCWFKYDIIPESGETGEWLLLPVRFDSTVRVSLVGGVDEIGSEPYRGLLAVRVSSSTAPRTLEVSIVPDSKMQLLSLTPYASLLTFGACALLLRRSSRSRPSV